MALGTVKSIEAKVT